MLISGNNNLANKPKLKVSGLGWDFDGKALDFEDARLFPYDGGALIAAEGTVIGSYEDLEKLIEKEPYKYKPFLEVIFLPIMVGG
jgi:hypothetical protein